MKKYFNFLLLLIFIGISCLVNAQRSDIDTSKILQLSGVVVSEQDLTPMPYITVYDKSIVEESSPTSMVTFQWFPSLEIRCFFHTTAIKHRPILFLIRSKKIGTASYICFNKTR